MLDWNPHCGDFAARTAKPRRKLSVNLEIRARTAASNEKARYRRLDRAQRRDDRPRSEAEERRLFYVAITHARESLMISGTSKNIESRFVVEAQLQPVAKAA